MSLLRKVLHKNSESSGFDAPKALTSRAGVKAYAASVKSSAGGTIRSVRSVAESVSSFYTALTGGTRVPKRRRPDVSRLGAPKFYKRDPKPPPDAPGAKVVDAATAGPLTAAHGMSFATPGTDKAWCSVVLYSHAKVTDPYPVYHARATVQGELRLKIDEPARIASIDVWLVASSASVFDLALPPFINARANLWKREDGDPITPSVNEGRGPTFKGTFPQGTYVFPFEFPALPRDVEQDQQDHRVNQPKKTRLLLPPTHAINSNIGGVGKATGHIRYVLVTITTQTRPRLVTANPCFPPSLQVPSGSQHPPRRPYRHERRLVLPDQVSTPRAPDPAPTDAVPVPAHQGGLALLPRRGGRLDALAVRRTRSVPRRDGRSGGHRKIDPIFLSRHHHIYYHRSHQSGVSFQLGVQAPEVYAPGQTLRFGLLLWCTDRAALDALAHPDSIQVRFLKAVLFGLDVLEPHHSARKNRALKPVGEPGRVWRADEGDAAAAAVAVRQPKGTGAARSPAPAGRSRMVELYSAAADETESDDLTALTDGPSISASREPPSAASSPPAPASPSSSERPRSPSPTPSFEDVDDPDDDDEPSHTVRLDGSVVIPADLRPPSYRWKYQGIEYLLHLTVTHPEYSHVSPRATGILAEAPVWLVTDPPLTAAGGDDDPDASSAGPVALETLPKTGSAIPLPPDCVRRPKVIGEATNQERPSKFGSRDWSYM
ncbi:hypothetical protein PUNSTDRAFT_50345 [Punctularia strigosozonata HHB-11173 SS5]|uniref:uncharacterized protein n=1 Tax=Punctularia strigosozonata (strain HHB-11173) TaxID=741275 RepID=UPI0004417F74|nr:uncharacterized protein PUNSTDRAFT_50345 [Punctularia strigosozonata HHB-11173 SS5]EIN11294.1 hypothetical protein PUNSTDRAFT_50345 [Punctularia strigosozonata HHB-11173 SS5]